MDSKIATREITANLLLSIQQYEHMLEYMQGLDKDVGTASPAALLESNETLLKLQKDTSETEQALFAQFTTYCEDADDILPLIATREHLMRDVLFLNQRIRVKATGIRSFITHEMGKLHTGLSAMNGYRQHQHNQGRIVNSSL